MSDLQFARCRHFVLGLFALSSAVAHAAVLHVPASYPTIQSAIDAAVTGDKVLVSAGTYAENIDIEHKVIDVVSVSGPGATIIDGQGLGSVVRLVMDERNQVPHLEGFTLRGGLADRGGGLFQQGGDPIIENLIVTDNTARLEGGGVWMVGWASLGGSRVSRNHAPLGGGIYAYYLSGNVSDNVIENNSADSGAGIYQWTGQGYILGNVIRHNVARRGNGGGFFAELLPVSSPYVRNNLIVGNQARTGGGIYVTNLDDFGVSGIWLVNNTVADNESHRGGGQLIFNQWSAWHRLYNNIFAGQPAITCSIDAFGVPLFDHNDVFGGAEGSCASAATTGTNLAEDPLFTTGPKGQPYRLGPDSPAVDAGSNDYASRKWRDLAGQRRIIDGGHGKIVDMGAFEYKPAD